MNRIIGWILTLRGYSTWQNSNICVVKTFCLKKPDIHREHTQQQRLLCGGRREGRYWRINPLFPSWHKQVQEGKQKGRNPVQTKTWTEIYSMLFSNCIWVLPVHVMLRKSGNTLRGPRKEESSVKQPGEGWGGWTMPKGSVVCKSFTKWHTKWSTSWHRFSFFCPTVCFPSPSIKAMKSITENKWV